VCNPHASTTHTLTRTHHRHQLQLHVQYTEVVAYTHIITILNPSWLPARQTSLESIDPRTSRRAPNESLGQARLAEAPERGSARQSSPAPADTFIILLSSPRLYPAVATQSNHRAGAVAVCRPLSKPHRILFLALCSLLYSTLPTLPCPACANRCTDRRRALWILPPDLRIPRCTYSPVAKSYLHINPQCPSQI
jgi:hypothetical protein